MRMKDVADGLTKELGIYLTMSRLFRYEERAIIPGPSKLDGKKVRDYSAEDAQKIRATVILAELGIPLRDVKVFLERPTEKLREQFTSRIKTVSNLVEKAHELLGNTERSTPC